MAKRRSRPASKNLLYWVCIVVVYFLQRADNMALSQGLNYGNELLLV